MQKVKIEWSTMVKISVSTWSLHRELPFFWNKDVPGKIRLIDFPKLCIKEFGVDAVELCQMHFLSTDQNYIDKVKDALDRSRLRLVNIPVDLGYAAEPDIERRKAGFNILRKWFEIAKYLGSPSVRVNTGKGEGEEALQIAIDGYRELAEMAKETGVRLLIENHGGISEKAEDIIRIIEEVGSEYLGTCPDFGNFPPETRYEGLAKLAKYAAVVHAKTFEFNEKGEDTKIDVKRCVNILRQEGFHGYYSVEFEGQGDQREGVRKTIALLKRYL